MSAGVFGRNELVSRSALAAVLDESRTPLETGAKAQWLIDRQNARRRAYYALHKLASRARHIGQPVFSSRPTLQRAVTPSVL